MRPRKRFGQNFLHDKRIVEKIVAAIRPAPDDNILEIGPGHGAITKLLIASGCNLSLVEIDRDLVAELQETFSVPVIEADILQFDFSQLSSATRIVGNLPYNISTPLLFRLFHHLDRIADMTLMLQKEVVERITASPGNKTYGRLTVMCQYHCEVEYLFTVGPGAFTPAPKVDSAIIRLSPRPRATTVDLSFLEKMLADVFSKRRKTLRNAFSGYLSADELTSLGIDPGLRPENLSVDEYITCARAAS